MEYIVLSIYLKGVILIRKPLRYLRVKVDLSWGSSVRRYIFSKARESYLIPPPTTLIGALAYGYTRYRSLPEETAEGENLYSSAELVRKKIHSVNVKVNVPFIHYSDLNRIWWYKEREKTVKTDVVALGKTYKGFRCYANTPDLDIVYILKENIEDNEVKLLTIAGYAIIRLGGSYSLASVRYVSWGMAKPIEFTIGRTSFSFWADLSSTPIPSNILRQLVVDPSKTPIGNYSNAEYREHVYPLRIDTLKPLQVDIEITDSSQLYDVEGEVVVVER